MDLSIAEFSGLLDEVGNVGVVEDVAYYGNCGATGGIDRVCYVLCLLC
jgi:hypothetical protein